MFLLFFIVIAAPGAVIVMAVVAIAVGVFKLMPKGMSFFWLLVPTMGLAAGGATMATMVEEFVIRPIQLQNEIVGGQLVTPLALRSYRAFGFQDPGWTWGYDVDPVTAARLTRNCRPDPNPRAWCDIVGVNDAGRSAFIRIEGTRLTINEWFS